MAKPDLTDRALAERLPSWGVLVLESHHSDRFTMEWRTHRFVKVVYVLRGQGLIRVGKQNLRFGTGDVIVVPEGTRNKIEDDPAAASSLYVGCIGLSLLEFDPQLPRLLSPQLIHGDGHFASRVATLLRRMVHAQQTPGSSRAVAMVADALKLIQLVVERPRKAKKQESGIDAELLAMQRYIDTLPQRFFEQTAIEDAASSLGMARRTFTKRFSELTGETWLTHIRRLAIQHAQRRLSQTDLPIASVAFECGFNDLSTFYRQFKSQCGISPAKYRKSQAAND